jgi:hypothetical protein
MKKVKGRITEGSIYKIPIEVNRYSYARVIKDKAFAFYNYLGKDNLNLNDILELDVLFILHLYPRSVNKSQWEKIGSKELDEKFKKLPPQFIQDVWDFDNIQIYENGSFRKATKKECIGLERMAVWEVEHVESRIRDHFAGRKNLFVELSKIKFNNKDSNTEILKRFGYI